MNGFTGSLFFIVLGNIRHCEDKYSMLLFIAFPNNHEALRLKNHCCGFKSGRDLTTSGSGGERECCPILEKKI